MEEDERLPTNNLREDDPRSIRKQPIFRVFVETIVGPHLKSAGYTLQTAIANQKPPVNPCKYFLPYLKSLGAVGYGHIVFMYGPTHRDPQEFEVLALRYDGTYPAKAYAVRIHGEPRTNLFGYVVDPQLSPLPLMYHPRPHWSFRNRQELVTALETIGNQLEVLLPWMDDPQSSQVIDVDPHIYADLLEAVAKGQTTVEEALAVLEGFAPASMQRYAGTAALTRASSEVENIIRSMHINKQPIEAITDPILIPYLIQGLRGETPFVPESFSNTHNTYHMRRNETM